MILCVVRIIFMTQTYVHVASLVASERFCNSSKFTFMGTGRSSFPEHCWRVTHCIVRNSIFLWQ